MYCRCKMKPNATICFMLELVSVFFPIRNLSGNVEKNKFYSIGFPAIDDTIHII